MVHVDYLLFGWVLHVEYPLSLRKESAPREEVIAGSLVFIAKGL
jgi:hypothetical protein